VFKIFVLIVILVKIDHFDLNMTVRAKMAGGRRGRGRPRGNPNVEENVNPDAQMWAQLMQQNQQKMHLVDMGST
jgi:hypothetical protein